MCLSDVFELKEGTELPLMKYVGGIKVEGDTITLTDMMGARKTVSGTIKNIDLLKNVILIEAS